jgi:ACS family hexuronate transporter-like MFS transporter
MGVMQNFGSNLLGSFVAPVLLVAFATAYGWHRAFYLAGIPGLISAFLIWRFIQEPARLPAAIRWYGGAAAIPGRPPGRNFCTAEYPTVLLHRQSAGGISRHLLDIRAAVPHQVRGFTPTQMGWLMGTLGISATFGSFVVSGLSDRIGRKPVVIFTCFLGLILPLGALFYHGSIWILAVTFFFGWAVNGAFPLFMATIPSESVAANHMTTAMALIMGAGEVIGGVLAPWLAGLAADAAGLAAAIWILMGLCIVAGILGVGLQETAPARIKKPQNV